MGKVIALDLETWLISKEHIAPPPVVLSIYSESEHRLALDIEQEMSGLLDSGNTLVWHNASYDMSVLYKHYPDLRSKIWDAYNDGRIACTKVRESLLHLSVVGHLRNNKSLAGCVNRYFDEDISDGKSAPNAWRLRYKELDGVPLVDWPAEAVDYALSDTKWGYRVYQIQAELANPSGECSMGTEQLQTKFDFIGRLITIKGFLIDTKLVETTQAELESKGKVPLAALVDAGFATVKASGKHEGKVSIREKLLRAYLEENYSHAVKYSEPSKSFPNGQVSLSSEAVAEYPQDAIIDALKEYQSCRKLLSTYLPNLLRGPTIHPQYNVLVETGRTSSHGHAVKNREEMFPAENVQNLPRGGNVREAHIARPGKVLVSIDYGHLELDCLAQVTYEMFGHSEMMKLINAGKDPHCGMGAQLMGLKQHRVVTYEEFVALKDAGDEDAKFFRQMAKAANFGFPGGLGAARMVEYARLSYGISDMTMEKAVELRSVFLDTFPEVQQLFNWYSLQESSEGWGYDSSGRWRAKCSYCNGLNGIVLQSRSADGAKNAGIKLVEACETGALQGCDVLAFIHDEYILEMPNDETLLEQMDVAMTLMLKGMSEYLPHVRITVEADAMDRWLKSGPFIHSVTKSLDPVKEAK